MKLASFTGGGSFILFKATSPAFRLLIYEDGIEVRAMFQCFFIPYDRMSDLDQAAGFFQSGLVIKSNLPEVPSWIRFYDSFLGADNKALTAVKEQRDRFMAGLQNG